jgi:hypothetical protein
MVILRIRTEERIQNFSKEKAVERRIRWRGRGHRLKEAAVDVENCLRDARSGRKRAPGLVTVVAEDKNRLKKSDRGLKKPGELVEEEVGGCTEIGLVEEKEAVFGSARSEEGAIRKKRTDKEREIRQRMGNFAREKRLNRRGDSVPKVEGIARTREKIVKIWAKLRKDSIRFLWSGWLGGICQIGAVPRQGIPPRKSHAGGKATF